MTELDKTLLIDIRELSELSKITVGGVYHMLGQRESSSVKLSQRSLRFSLPKIRECSTG
jgi:hypothetical protein